MSSQDSLNMQAPCLLNPLHLSNVFDVISHSLRRTFITELSNKMISARVIQKLARHSSLAITQLYIETNEEQLLQAVNL